MDITHTYNDDNPIFSNDSAFEVPYGQAYCLYCGGQIDTYFRCMKCGRQFHPKRSSMTVSEEIKYDRNR
jgi:hypothetical protein